MNSATVDNWENGPRGVVVYESLQDAKDSRPIVERPEIHRLLCSRLPKYLVCGFDETAQGTWARNSEVVSRMVNGEWEDVNA